MSKDFKNEDRRRYYGLKLGDIVKYAFKTCNVFMFDPSDNNRVVLAYWENPYSQRTFHAVAERCNILVKVEENPISLFNREIDGANTEKGIFFWVKAYPDKANKILEFYAEYKDLFPDSKNLINIIEKSLKND